MIPAVTPAARVRLLARVVALADEHDREPHPGRRRELARLLGDLRRRGVPRPGLPKGTR